MIFFSLSTTIPCPDQMFCRVFSDPQQYLGLCNSGKVLITKDHASKTLSLVMGILDLAWDFVSVLALLWALAGSKMATAVPTACQAKSRACHRLPTLDCWGSFVGASWLLVSWLCYTESWSLLNILHVVLAFIPSIFLKERLAWCMKSRSLFLFTSSHPFCLSTHHNCDPWSCFLFGETSHSQTALLTFRAAFGCSYLLPWGWFAWNSPHVRSMSLLPGVGGAFFIKQRNWLQLITVTAWNRNLPDMYWQDYGGGGGAMIFCTLSLSPALFLWNRNACKWDPLGQVHVKETGRVTC